jgi:hypothetical protein
VPTETPHREGEFETIFEVCSPSALARKEAELIKGGVPADELAGARAAFAALGLGEAPSTPSRSLRQRVMASAARPGRYGIFADRLARLFDLSIVDAERLAASLEDPAVWQPFIVPGVDLVPVLAGPKYPGSIASVARLTPGSRFPAHVHHGEETMFLLDGGFREDGEHGAEVWRGDELFHGTGSDHAFTALEGVPCIAASIILGSLDFK